MDLLLFVFAMRGSFILVLEVTCCGTGAIKILIILDTNVIQQGRAKPLITPTLDKYKNLAHILQWTILEFLTRKDVLTKNAPKLPFLVHVPNFGIFFFLTYVTVGSCSMLT